MANLSVSPLDSPTLWGAATWRAALAGAGAGLLSFFGGEVVGALVGMGGEAPRGLLELLLSSAFWSGAIGLILGAAMLICDNIGSLRGQWHRDLRGALPLFFGLSFGGGLAGQLAYSMVQNSLTRGIGWSLMGAGVGVGIGILRRDKVQAGRGALGGAIGGFLGGFVFDGLTLISSAGNGSFSRLVGQILMGALIALLMRVVQQALKDAYLLGTSTGPYEGKEYPLNTARVSVGRADDNDISLFRNETVPPRLGALCFENGAWWWRGEPISINGQSQTSAPLASGDTLQMGNARFRFYSRPAKDETRNDSIAPIAPPFSRPAPLSPPTKGAPTSRPPSTPRPVVALVTPDAQIVRVPDGEGPFSVGRMAPGDLIFPDMGVSSRHAQLEWNGASWTICDLNSTNGTFLNGAKLAPQAPQPLKIGDRVRFGSFETTLSAV